MSAIGHRSTQSEFKSMAAIYLTESDVESLVDVRAAVEVLDEVFRRWTEGGVDNIPRRRARAAGIVLHSMSAAAGYLPARESALMAWAPSPKQALGLLIAPFAEPALSTDVSGEIGAALSEALIGLLKDELSAAEANMLIQARMTNP